MLMPDLNNIVNDLQQTQTIPCLHNLLLTVALLKYLLGWKD